jgi:hypothetical protein
MFGSDDGFLCQCFRALYPAVRESEILGLKEKINLLKFAATFAGIHSVCTDLIFLKYEQWSMCCFMGWLFNFFLMLPTNKKEIFVWVPDAG